MERLCQFNETGNGKEENLIGKWPKKINQTSFLVVFRGIETWQGTLRDIMIVELLLIISNKGGRDGWYVDRSQIPWLLLLLLMMMILSNRIAKWLNWPIDCCWQKDTRTTRLLITTSKPPNYYVHWMVNTDKRKDEEEGNIGFNW